MRRTGAGQGKQEKHRTERNGGGCRQRENEERKQGEGYDVGDSGSISDPEQISSTSVRRCKKTSGGDMTKKNIFFTNNYVPQVNKHLSQNEGDSDSNSSPINKTPLNETPLICQEKGK